MTPGQTSYEGPSDIHVVGKNASQTKPAKLKSAGYGRTKPAPVVAISLIPPATSEKERFRTHEAMLIPPLTGFSPDALQPFISLLKA